MDKVRFDAFQWTSLEPLLRGLNINDLVVCGVVTNLCVETTIRSAFMRDFPVTLLADCCAAQTRRLHELSLEVLSSLPPREDRTHRRGFDLTEAQAQAQADAEAQAEARSPRGPGNRLNTQASSRQPSRNNPRNASATPTNAAAVPCPAATRSTMPSPAAPSHAPRPAGTTPTGRRQARTAAQPSTSPARNGHAVDATPPSPSPSA